MPFEVFDFRRDIGNLIIQPDIRSRFLRMEPGEVAGRHSHDLGAEIFLILAGQCEMEIEGHREVLGPGQMCFAARDEMHQAKVVGDEPMIMYLSVTPHIEPTHTSWANGEKLPPRYSGHRILERVATDPPPVTAAELLDRQVAAAQALADVAALCARRQAELVDEIKRAIAAGDPVAQKRAADDLWSTLYPVYRALTDLSVPWNALAVQLGIPPRR
jgi:mannose-6-phosphate isomerase-like protein (cupin superfamily)